MAPAVLGTDFNVMFYLQMYTEDEPEGEAFDLPIHHVVTLNYGHVLSEVTNLIILE